MMMWRGIVEDTRLEEGYLWRKNQKALFGILKMKQQSGVHTQEPL